MNRRHIMRVGTLCGAALPMVFAFTPAAAETTAPTPTLVATASATGPVDVECYAVGVASQTDVTYVVYGTAKTTGFVAISTGGSCYIKTVVGGKNKWWGGASNAYTGNVAPIGPWTATPIPLNELTGFQLCAYGSATDLNNNYHPDPKDPGC